ncbi:MAG: xanthine dehydrogenase family protein molybdopterin-binding subunit [Hyphomicrobium sp.]|uniref:xanthine dehydrogenase family protein molybdopterin-binding subunit n=1 Tax=Hyphomicrobium sp. TaxID=82 RepID=UPI001329F5AE|nr:xanthine dehydrogenase family protein molybdopterin-binding subunit [Hyphomicrobium sp.]KAB2940539.1 MAG: xanthine dehydrogenase family protein molybdopterin-binding subunit [Hyphomicrobium sp.]MBZ0210322.1 xanthine dehydrogenase family protein molybdopterin-binding subunit [Hyphomicrobium sp.]
MNVPVSADRRQFLQGSAALGLVVGFHLPLVGRARAAEPAGEFVPNAFIRIAPDNTVTVLSKHIEFGQGPYTGIATILADELDADWAQMRVESAPADVKRYANSAFGIQGTGGSTAMANSWDQLRTAGAEARARLVAAAAKQWGVDAGSISIEKGVVRDTTGKSATFGQLAALAQETQVAGPFQPKEPAAWKLIGTRLPKVDTLSKTNGTAMFTIDVKLPDMLTCVLARPSRFNAKVKSFDAAPALAVPGVKEAFAVPQGVAVLADGFWAAKKGRDALKIEWDESGTEARGSQEIIKDYLKLARVQGAIARNDGDTDGALSGAAKVIEATYVFPYLAHAPLEPNNCVIQRTDEGADLTFGSQLQTVDQGAAAAVLGLKPEQVKIKTLLAGGSFGRRATPAGDMAAEAAEVLKGAQHKGPIKVLWTREDDIKGGRYRPIFVHRLRGAIDGEGNIVGWDQVIVGQSFMKGSPFESGMVKNGVDQTMVEGASTLPYQIPNLRVSAHMAEVGVPTLWWRSVGSTHTAFSTETFLDQLAEAAGVDPLVVRRKLLTKHPRHLAVLELAAEKAGWGTPPPQGRARGLAVHESFHSFVAHVVEVSIGEEGLPKVERVVVAADCGIPINPDVIKAQLEGGMGFGLSAAMFASIDLEEGRVVQSNFHDYRVLRINEMPDVEVHIVPSKEKPTGIGEPGVPPIAPAVANAWSKLTGQRVFTLPFAHSAAKA